MALESTYHTIWYGVWNGYHTIWYECMEWYGFGIHIPYHMVWVSGKVTIPYGMSVWKGYHTIWYECMVWYGFEIHIPYHVI